MYEVYIALLVGLIIGLVLGSTIVSYINYLQMKFYQEQCKKFRDFIGGQK